MSDDPFPLLPGWLTDPDTPGVRTVVPRVSVLDLAHLDDATLEAVVTAMRDDARAQYEAHARWVRAIRARRAAGRKSERDAARASGVSRATIRKATSARQ